MDMRDFQGRLLHCLPAKRPPKREAGGEEEGKGGYREAKEAKLRADAGNKATWNTLFMRQDTGEGAGRDITRVGMCGFDHDDTVDAETLTGQYVGLSVSQ